MFLYLEAAGTPMHVGSVLRVQPPESQSEFAAGLAEHLKYRLSALPIVRRVLQDAPLALGHPLWRELDELDFDRHVVCRRLPRPGSEAQLAGLIGRLHAEPLPRDRPLWQIVLIDGLADGTVACYMRSHHALTDGQAGVQVTQAILDLEPKPMQPRGAAAPPAAAAEGEPPPAMRTALRATARQFAQLWRGVPQGLRELRQQGASQLGRGLRDSVWLAPKTVFNRTIGGGRRVAFCSLPLDSVKQLAKAAGGSLNDAVMALVADALREHFLRRGELPSKPLIAAMPVSLRSAGSDAGNEVSMVQCPLATDIADPRSRLQAIIAATQQIKGRVSAFKGLIPTDFPGLAAPLWAAGLSHLWQRGRLSERLPALANLVVSNVPGPPVPLYMGGGRIRRFYPVSIVTHGLGLNITLVSYAGSLEIGVVTAADLLDKPASLCRGIERALLRQRRAWGLA